MLSFLPRSEFGINSSRNLTYNPHKIPYQKLQYGMTMSFVKIRHYLLTIDENQIDQIFNLGV